MRGEHPVGRGDLGVDARVDHQPALTTWGHTWRSLLALAISVGVTADVLGKMWDEALWRVPLDIGVGLAAYALTFLRRRFPMPIALVVLGFATFSASAAGPAVLTSVSVATRRIYWQIGLLAALNVASTIVFFEITPTTSHEPLWVTTLLGTAFTLALLGWGMYIGSRRELLWTLRQRAERAEAERDLRAGKARSDERARIAREMHDVLAHRISQVSMHAGALAFRADLDAAALRTGITEVQRTANEALADLRSVLGVLRDPDTGTTTHRPQPTYGDLAELLATARATGAHIELDEQVDARAVPPALGRTLYRIVQEGITNARRHAPGARLDVQITGDPDHGVEIVLRNPLGFGPPATPGAGLGLVGLAERVELSGGHLTHGRHGSSFEVRASLPWAT